MATSVVGIDIGSGVLRGVEVGQATQAKPTLLRYHEVPLPEGAVLRGEVVDADAVADGLKRLWSAGGFKTKQIVLGMGNQRVLARGLSVPKMPLKRIRESLASEVQDLLPVPVASALLDFYPISESEGEHGPVVNGLLIAAVKEAVLGNVRAAHLAGLTTTDVDLIPFALSRALVSRPRMPGTVALVDIGADTTSVVIATEGIPQFVRIIPAGGDELTRALQASLETDAVQAEGIKRDIGLAGQAPTDEPPAKQSKQTKQVKQHQQATQVIRQLGTEQLANLHNTLNYFATTRPADPVRQIVLSGGGARLTGLSEAVADLTGLAVVAGDPLGSLSLSRAVDEDELRRNGHGFTVALGLALGRAS